MGFPDPFSGSVGWQARYGSQEVSQFRSADMIAEKWIFAQDMEGSPWRAITRHPGDRGGRFKREIVPLAGVTADEGPRRDTSLRRWHAEDAARRRADHRRRVEPDFRRGRGPADRLGARGEGTQAQTARAHPPHQRARADPVWMLTAPIPATAYALQRSGSNATTSPSSRSTKPSRRSSSPGRRTGWDLAKVNVNAVPSPSPPARATGARLMTTCCASSSAPAAATACKHVRGRRPGQRDDHRAAVMHAPHESPSPKTRRAAQAARSFLADHSSGAHVRAAMDTDAATTPGLEPHRQRTRLDAIITRGVRGLGSPTSR